MTLMRVTAPAWLDSEFGVVRHLGEEFEASEYRAAELARTGLAVYAMSEVTKVTVTADPPPPDPDPEPPVPAPRKVLAKRKGR